MGTWNYILTADTQLWHLDVHCVDIGFLLTGVPLAAPVAGVAIGLVTRTDKDDPFAIQDYKLLTDILVKKEFTMSVMQIKMM